MSLPAEHHRCWARLAGGGLGRLKSEFLALQLLATRLRRSTATDEAKESEVRAFFIKYERALVKEIAQLPMVV